MKTAAIYCRVSTDNQESEGTSLQTQLEACLRYCHDKDYDAAYRLSEAYSGLTLDRPKLNELRELVRAGDIDVVVCHCLDRLSRDPVHGVIIIEELEKHHVILEAATETVDSSEVGKLISYIRGFASKLEAQKIRERTMRGKKARALAGKLPANSHAHLFGYSYLPGKGIGEGVRYVNEQQADVVRQMYQWLLEGLSTDAITYRLREMAIPTPTKKGYWIRSTVLGILKNPAYYGKTYAFTCTYGKPKRRLKPDTKRKNTGIIWKPREEWLEIPNATPPIISEATYNAAQERLGQNRRMAARNSKNEYLLHGHIYCARCGRAFWGAPGIKPRNGKRYEYPFYQCSGRLKKVTPVKCNNRQYNAKKIEELVWAQIEEVLRNPELILAELERREQEQESSIWQRDLERLINQLANRKKQKDRVWTAFRITGDEDTFRRDIAILDREIQQAEAEIAKLEERIEGNKQFTLNANNLKQACEVVASNLKTLSFEEKRLAFQALQVRVSIDGDNINIHGVIPLQTVGHITNSVSGWRPPGRH
ncbi:recombinase family protein [Chloroflexota bacterium]